MMRRSSVRTGSQKREGSVRARDDLRKHHTPPARPAGKPPAPCCEAEAICCVTITHIASLPDQVATPHRILFTSGQPRFLHHPIRLSDGYVKRIRPPATYFGPEISQASTNPQMANLPHYPNSPPSQVADMRNKRSRRIRAIAWGSFRSCDRTASDVIRWAATSLREPSCSRRTGSSRTAHCTGPAATGHPRPGGNGTRHWGVSASPARRRCRRPAAWPCRPAASC